MKKTCQICQKNFLEKKVPSSCPNCEKCANLCDICQLRANILTAHFKKKLTKTPKQ